MAAGSDLLLDDVFNAEVDEKVVSDLVGSLESQLAGAGPTDAGAAATTTTAGATTVTTTTGATTAAVGATTAGATTTITTAVGAATTTAGAATTAPAGGSSSSPPPPSAKNPGNPGNTRTANSDVQPSKHSPELANTSAGVPGGVTSIMDGAGPSPTSSAVAPVSVVSDPPAAATDVKTLNGSNLVVATTTTTTAASHTPGAVPKVNNTPLSTTNTTIPASLPNAAHTVVVTTTTTTPTGIAPPQPALSTGQPTVTLVRPPMNPMQLSPVCTQSPVISISISGPTVANSITTTTPPVTPHGPSPTVRPQTTTVSAAPTMAVKSPAVLQCVRPSMVTAATAPGPPAVVRTIAAQVLAPRLAPPQQTAPNVHNIQLPPGMVLVRSESGQLLMIHHQTLSQMQAQSQSQSAMTPRPATPTSTPSSVQITSLQAPGGTLLTRQVTPNPLIKQVQTTTTTTLQRPPVLQNTIMLGASVTTPGHPLGTATVGQQQQQPGSVAPALTQRMGPAAGTPMAPTPISAETLENVKKCRNFLSTLIKLASSGKQTPETTANVKELVKNLLEGKIEPEDFTSRLYKELNSSPQPYLVPFLKRSLPALRQMTSDSTAFIHQSQLPLPCTQPSTTCSALTAMVLRPTLSSTSNTPATAAITTTPGPAARTPVVTLTQAPHAPKPAAIVPQPQQQGATVRPQVSVAQPSLVAVRGQAHPRVLMSQPPVVKPLHTCSALAAKQNLASGPRGSPGAQSVLTVAQRNKLKETGGGGTFRGGEDDDINDVTSMAGVDLSEESARILATNSDLVGAVTRSCKDQPFLSSGPLTRRVQEIGRKFGVGDLGHEVINYISHATKQRLQDLLEKASQVAQQKNLTFKEDDRFEQVTDVRAQLKFFEQLDHMEKQRKGEQEREILMKAAKSRSRQEDPEQLRLKQKAKEMQQQEQAQIRQREANLTALAAIGPRKKRKMGSPANGAVAEGSGSGAAQPGGSNGGGGSRQFTRQRITRVNLRDLLFCLENERESGHSHLLYKGLLK